MKDFLTILLLLSTLCIFCIFTIKNNDTKTVLNVDTPTKLTVINSTNRKNTKTENICLKDIETFSVIDSEDLYKKYGKKFNLTKSDVISLGYLAQEFSQKALSKGIIKIKSIEKSDNCNFANIKIAGTDYRQLLLNSGFAIINKDLPNKEKFKENLEKARNLDLVVLNHKSNKFHTLDCPYGDIAHDKILIPKKQLPENTQPCKYCNLNNENKTTSPNTIQKVIPQKLKFEDGDLTTYITDYTIQTSPNTDCTSYTCKDLVNRINNANATIDIAIYGYTDIPKITTALNNAYNRGVKIRYVYDENFDNKQNHYKDNSKIIKLSSKHRSDKTLSKTLSNMLMHNKFIIFDNKTVYTGSMNLSPSGLSEFDVNSIIIMTSESIAKLYTEEFEQMLSGKFHTNKIKLLTNRIFKLGNSELEIYFSPIDKNSNRIIQLIKDAKSYIYIPSFLITHNGISNELIKAKQKGVDVRIIIDANSVNTRNTKHALLRDNGILLKTENYAGKLHSKLIIIDDTYLISGSMNFSNSGENKNDENIVIIKNEGIAKAHKNYFLYLWELIPNKYLKSNAKPESYDSIGSCFDGVDNNFNGKIDKEELFCIPKNN